MGIMVSKPRVGLTVLVFALLVGATGCASGGGGASSRPPGSSSDHIVQAEFDQVLQLSALEAVRRLRPQWLQARSGHPPQVHVDGTPRGTTDVLSSLRAAEVGDMTFMNASDATTRFGTNYIGGVIIVVTRR